MRWFMLGLCLPVAAGCSTVCSPNGDQPMTLLSWEVGPREPEKSEAKSNGENNAEGPGGTNGDKPNGTETTLADAKHGKNGEEPPEAKEFASDRPDFTEASNTVGLGRIQFETGYTYSRNKEAGVSSEHSFPEILLRVGVFAEWVELRFGLNSTHTTNHHPRDAVFGVAGLEDCYLGSKISLTDQKGYMPETAVILYTTVPMGHHELTADKALPGMSYLYGWDVVEDCLSLAGSTVFASAVDDTGHNYLELAQSVTVGYTLSERLGAFTEFFGFFPHGANAPEVTALYYFNGGFTYKFTPNFQYDIRGGVGLNRHADDYFLGTGFAVRY
jgi:hypothetical protein